MTSPIYVAPEPVERLADLVPGARYAVSTGGDVSGSGFVGTLRRRRVTDYDREGQVIDVQLPTTEYVYLRLEFADEGQWARADLFRGDLGSAHSLTLLLVVPAEASGARPLSPAVDEAAAISAVEDARLAELVDPTEQGRLLDHGTPGD
jgi:hypothetical protein